MRMQAILISMIGTAALGACNDQSQSVDVPLTGDPVVARALNDPLMIDPDLAHRNEANAVLSIGFDHALPPFEASENGARLAREQARLILLDRGRLQDLPDLLSAATGRTLAEARGDAKAMADAFDISRECVGRLSEGYEWAARMPAISEIMPHGQVRQAAGVDNGDCDVRVVSYLTPASAEDTLEWHYNLAQQANLNIDLFAQPEVSMFAEKRGINTAVQTSAGPSGMTAVDVLYWVGE